MVVTITPDNERYQKARGMWLIFIRSDEIHCTMKRDPNSNCPPRPNATQKSQERGSSESAISTTAPHPRERGTADCAHASSAQPDSPRIRGRRGSSRRTWIHRIDGGGDSPASL